MNEQAKLKYDNIKTIIEENLDRYMEIKYPENIYKSMRYSVLAGGKRLRPVIAVETSLILGGKMEEIMPSACAIEMLHCESLIHDDLPCMDNDDYRRGKLTNHKVFGEAIATLAGDALLSFAPKIIIDNTPKTVENDTIIKILNEFFIAAGVDGIISGQIVDIESEKKEISKETIEYINEYKTAKLFECAVRIGAITAGADDKILQNLTLYAQYYGQAFQIYDDILDVTSTFKQIGKTPGKDEKSGKSTYVSMFGIEKAKNKILYLCKNAYDILRRENIKSEILNSVLSDIVSGVSKCC